MTPPAHERTHRTIAERRASRVLWLTWALAGLGLLLSLARGPVLREQPPLRLTDQSSPWCEGGFEPAAVYPATDAAGLPVGVRTVGSWIGGDAWQGTVETAWAPVRGSALAVYVAGYPEHAGCRLTAEFRDRGGRVTSIPCPLSNPGERWQRWRIAVPAGTEAVRFAAQDRAGDAAGWLAFSEPLVAPREYGPAIFQLAQVFTTVALAFTLIFGPGLLWMPERASAPVRTTILIGAGPAVLVGLGLLVWAADGVVRPHHLGFVLTTAVWAALGARLYRRPPVLAPGLAAVMAIAALVVVTTAAKASFSRGPDGELYRGTISRTLTVGDRSDARISFHVVQTVAHHVAPWDPMAEGYFSPWTFFSRGPLAGLAAVPVSLATSGRPPRTMPEQAWVPFDTTGFAAYRIVLMALASTVFVALFAAVLPFAGERWAVIAAGLLALCPFAVHDVMFTWPKWEATAWVLVAFLFAHERRPLVAGLLLGAGFLYHPLAALWAPWLGLWAWGREHSGWMRRLGAAARVGAGVVLIAGTWMLVGKFAPHQPGSTDAGQLGFLAYFRMADYNPATWGSWWHSRGMNFANTFVPLWLNTFHAHRVGSIYGESGAVVKFAFAWWNTLPFGMGLLLWVISLVTLVRGLRRHAGLVIVAVAGPALLLIVYWGAHATGLMRECGHPLLAGIVGLTTVLLARSRGTLARVVAHRVFPWLQLPETLLMLWLTTLLNRQPAGAVHAEADPVYLAVSVGALATAAWLLGRVR